MAGSPLKRLAREARARELLAAAAGGVVLTEAERELVERFSVPVASPGGQSRSSRPREVNVAGHRPASTPPGRAEVVSYGLATSLVGPAQVDELVMAEVRAKLPRELSFPEFRLRYFGWQTFFHQRKVIEAIEGARRMEVTQILIFPNSGKTTVIEDYICFRVAHDPNIRIQVVSEAESHAQKIVGRVKNRMTDPDFAEFQADFGPFHEEGSHKRWSANVVTVDGAVNDERDYTLQCRGWAAAVAGTRTDLLILDDVQSTKNLGQTDDIVRKFRQDFLSRPGRHTKVIVVGTRVDENDFYDKIFQAGIVHKRVQLPATKAGTVVPCDLDPAEGACNAPDTPHEESLCPELWPSHDLAFQRHQVGDPVWWRNYQQQPRSAGDGTFTRAIWDKCLDYGRVVEPLAGVPLCPVAFSIDPGMGKTGHTSLVAAMLGANELSLLDMEDCSNFERLEQIADLVESMAPLYRPSIVLMESDSHQFAYGRIDRFEKVAARFGFIVVPDRTSGEKSDPRIGLMAMAGAMNGGQIRIPAGDDFSLRRFELLRDQLLGWRRLGPKDYKIDSGMALWFLWRYWTTTRQVWQSQASDWGYRAMPAGMAPVSRREALRR